MIILGSLLIIVLVTGLSLANNSVTAQAESPPTPTTLDVNGEPILESGDTEGLILGAGIILFIILSGVVIQRTRLKNDNE